MTGMLLLHKVAERIVARWLTDRGRLDVQITAGQESLGAGKAVDITYAWQGGKNRIKVKADPYFGSDTAKTSDRGLTFYRPDASAYAFESIANSATRQPGWAEDSEADELYYYRLVLTQKEDEIAALMNESDDVFFSELWVDRDELVILPMDATRKWFMANADKYQARPVITGGVSSWNRLVPRDDIERAVPGARNVGPIFRSLSAGS